MEEARNHPVLEPTEPETEQGDDLLIRLSAPDNPIEVSLRPEKSAQALKQRIEQGYVHLKFTETRGGTELGVKLDRDSLELGGANFDNQTGKVHLEGGLTLNYVKVRCIADINLETLTGQGHLQAVEA